MRTLVLYTFVILCVIIGSANSEQNSSFDRVAGNAATPETCVSSSISTFDSNYGLSFLGSTSNSISAYATKSDNSAKNDGKHKNHNKGAILAHKFNKVDTFDTSGVLYGDFIASDRALYVLAFLCRLNV